MCAAGTRVIRAWLLTLIIINNIIMIMMTIIIYLNIVTIIV